MKLFSLILPRLYRALLLLLIMTVAPAIGGQPPAIAIIQGQNAAPYQQTVASFKAAIQQARPDIEFIQSDDMKALQPSQLVFALGSAAAHQSHTELSDHALLATMLIDDQEVQDASQATGVLLKVSVQQQLEWHRRLLPNAKRVGVLYDPQLNQQWVTEAKLVAAQMGLKIIAVPVASAQELPSALKELGRNADSILGITDKTVYSGKTAKAVLLFSFRNRIPFVGLSDAWTRAGALYSLDWDYQALGEQCAAIALDILNGKKANSIKPQLPKTQLYMINLKTAEQMKVSISQQLIDGAAKVYE